MFKNLRRVVYQVADIEKAKQWYRKVLEKEPVRDMPFIVSFEVGDCSLALIPGAEQQSQAQNTVTAFWAVEDVDGAYQRLLQLGARSYRAVDTMWHVKWASVLDPFGNILGITGPDQEAAKRSVEERPSETAMNAVFLRALAAVDPRAEIRGRDFLAEKLLSGERLKALKDPEFRKEFMGKRRAPGMYEFMLARSAFFDDLVEKALQESFPYIVFLGAGYDTRPYRFKELIRGTRILELDIHTTQQNKKELLQKAAIPVPEQVTFIPINFRTDRLSEVLKKAGLGDKQKALFIWEGVSYYLAPEMVDETLEAVKAVSLPGSKIGFDYVSWFPEMQDAYGVKELREIMRAHAAGELTGSFGIERGKTAEFFIKRGFTIASHYSAAEMERKYLTLRDGSLAGKVTGHFCFAYASVAG